MSVHNTNHFKGFDGLKLFQQNWTLSSSKATLVFVHGYTEHSSRYLEFANYLNAHDIDMYTYDQRGYGQSEGRRAYVNRFEDYMNDLQIFVEQHVPKTKPVFLMGHSMGGLIAVKYALDKSHDLNGFICSAAALKISEDISPFLQKISGILSILLPKLKTIKLDSTKLSRDPNVVEKYNQDELIYHKGTYARTGAEILKTTKDVASRFYSFSDPVLILHGISDQITDLRGSQNFFEKAISSDKSLNSFQDCYHELLFEPEKKQVMETIVNWIHARI